MTGNAAVYIFRRFNHEHSCLAAPTCSITLSYTRLAIDSLESGCIAVPANGTILLHDDSQIFRSQQSQIHSFAFTAFAPYMPNTIAFPARHPSFYAKPPTDHLPTKPQSHSMLYPNTPSQDFTVDLPGVCAPPFADAGAALSSGLAGRSSLALTSRK